MSQAHSRRSTPKCSRCGESGVIFSKQTNLCVFHYRSRQMCYDAQAAGKVVPPAEVVERLLRSTRDAGMRCPVCGEPMSWLAADGRQHVVTLQHDRDGNYRIICLSCNTRHQHFPGDEFYKTPTGHKHCPACGTTKPIGEFYQRKGRPGTTTECRPCARRITNEKAKRRREKR